MILGAGRIDPIEGTLSVLGLVPFRSVRYV